MTLEYRCSNCGTLLQTTNAEALDVEIELAHAERDAAAEVSRAAQAYVTAMAEKLNTAVTLLDGLLGLERGSGKAALAFVDRYRADVGEPPK